jgi:hypothetical protein
MAMYNSPMEYDHRDAYTGKLAERDLEIRSFDGQTLTLRYNPAADNQVQDGERIDESDLVQYARKCLDELPDATHMFPGLDRIAVDFGAL